MDRFKLIGIWLVAASLVLGVAACDDDGNGGGGDSDATDATSTTDTAPDATTSPDTTTTPDTTTPDTSEDTSAPDGEEDSTDTSADTDTNGPSCDNQGFTAAEELLDSDVDNGVFVYQAINAAGDDALSIEFYGFGGTLLPILSGPGTYPIAANADDRNYATCATCVLLYANCTETSCDTFLADSGNIVVTDVDPDLGVFTGTLEDATFVQVTINSTTFQSTPVPNGANWCIDSFAFDVGPECVVDADCAGSPNGDLCVSNTCVPACSSSGFTGVDFEFDTDGVSGAIYNAFNADMSEVLSVEFWDTGAGFPLDNVPATFTLGSSPSERNYATCSTCVLLSSGCDDEGFCEAFYYAIGGEVSIDSASDTALSGTLRNATLVEVTIAEDYTSTRVQGGATHCISSFNLDLSPSGCVTDVDCAGDANGEYCRLSDGACVECLTDSHCANDDICFANACQAPATPCTTPFDCTEASAPACNDDGAGNLTCGVIADCAGDDAAEHDDGPAAATPLADQVTATASTCAGAQEEDWFQFDVTAVDTTATVSVLWNDDSDQLAVQLFDSTGTSLGVGAVNTNPTTVTVPSLAAGTYYVVVTGINTSGTTIDYLVDLSLQTP